MVENYFILAISIDILDLSCQETAPALALEFKDRKTNGYLRTGRLTYDAHMLRLSR